MAMDDAKTPTTETADERQRLLRELTLRERLLGARMMAQHVKCPAMTVRRAIAELREALAEETIVERASGFCASCRMRATATYRRPDGASSEADCRESDRVLALGRRLTPHCRSTPLAAPTESRVTSSTNDTR
jgi:hypothetical protein